MLWTRVWCLTIFNLWRRNSLKSNINELMMIAVPRLLWLLRLQLIDACCNRRPFRLVVSIAVGKCVRVAMTTGHATCRSPYGVASTDAVQSVVDL